MVTFWLRQHQQDTGLADVVVEAVDDWLLTEWPLATFVFRVLPMSSPVSSSLCEDSL